MSIVIINYMHRPLNKLEYRIKTNTKVEQIRKTAVIYEQLLDNK